MIVQNNDGRPASVYVPDGESFTIAQQGAREQGMQVLAVRPKTTLALKTVLGLDTVGTARQFAGSHLFREVSVPHVLRDLSIFALVVSLGDVVGGEQSTLTLDDDVFLSPTSRHTRHRRQSCQQEAPGI